MHSVQGLRREHLPLASYPLGQEHGTEQPKLCFPRAAGDVRAPKRESQMSGSSLEEVKSGSGGGGRASQGEGRPRPFHAHGRQHLAVGVLQGPREAWGACPEWLEDRCLGNQGACGEAHQRLWQSGEKRREMEGRRRGLCHIDELWRNPERSTRHPGP